MKFRHLVQNALSQRNSLPLGFLVVPGAGLILLGLLVILLPQIFVALVSGTLMFIGIVLLVIAFRMRPTSGGGRVGDDVRRSPRIRVVDDEDDDNNNSRNRWS